MNQDIMNYIMQKMSSVLDRGQKLRLEKVLYDIYLQQDVEDLDEIDNRQLLEKFLAAESLEGRSTGTLNYYQFTIEKMFSAINKDAREITTDELRNYLSKYQLEKNVSKVTIDNIRRNLSSFFHG